jgi:O-acetyl-ADP-ribose deacetylase (regulator of RNase III)
MKTSVGRTKLEIASGDITELEVDAIANAATSELWMGAGVAGAIKRVGGEAIEKEAMLQGPIAIGEAVATTGHDLKARWVIHVAVMDPDLQTDANAIAKATHGALDCAERCHARSIAMPAFGTGVGDFPLYQCASIMVAETVAYLKSKPRTALRHVMFSVYSDAARAAFQHALAGSSRF